MIAYCSYACHYKTPARGRTFYPGVTLIRCRDDVLRGRSRAASPRTFGYLPRHVPTTLTVPRLSAILGEPNVNTRARQQMIRVPAHTASRRATRSCCCDNLATWRVVSRCLYDAVSLLCVDGVSPLDVLRPIPSVLSTYLPWRRIL